MKKIKHYKIVELLGSGGMGKVYKALDLMLERDVAIKVLHRHLWNDKKTDDRFIQEARAIARLVHPNIVTIHEVGMAGCGRYIVMEFVQGIPLGQLLMAKGALAPEYAIKLARQILSGLFSAHNIGILHRDIKPDNILIAENDLVKILDFGIAKMTAKKGLTAAGDILGTVEYMAPEQMLGEIIDHRCDIYAAGVVLYQMLTHRLPFQGKDAVAILYKIMNEDPPPPSYHNNQVGQELDQIVLKAISKIREERWETAEAFSIALESVLQNSRHSAVSLHGVNLDEFSTLSTEIDVGKNYESQKNLRSVFIGRDREFKRLVNLFSTASRGQGQTVILKGEAGVGKSTLANRLRNYAEQQQSWVLYGTCLYQEGLAPYLPYDDALRGFFSNDNHSLLEKERNKLKNMVGEQVPLLQGLLTSSGPGRFTPAENSELEHDSLFKALYQLISFISTLRPIILIIDDLHWSDEASLRLFHYLSHQVAKKRILLLGISRIERYDLQKHGKPTMIVDLLARFGREGICEQITLYRLSRERCDCLIDETLSSTLFTEEFYEFMYHETRGNPLFVLETLDLLRENGTIFRKDGVWYNKRDEPEIAVPRHVEDVFTRRLNALTNEEREILQVAAVIGIKFDAALLLHLLDISKITLLKSLQRVESELQIIVNTEHGFHFEHPLLREMLYNELSNALRQEYHLIIASELEKIYHGDFGARVGEVAGHLRQGGDHAKAAPLLYQAALRAFKLEAYREASRFVIDYMDSNKRSGQPEVESISNAELYLILGKCYEETGRWDESVAAYKQLLQLSEKKSNPKGQIDALQCLGRIQVKLGDFESALNTYRRCLEIAKQQQFSKMFSHLYNNLGVIHREKGNLDQALHYFKQTIQVVDYENGKCDKAHALNNIGIIANMRADYNLALDSYEKALKEFALTGDKKNQARVYHNIGLTYTDKGEFSRAIDAFEQCMKLTNKVEDKQLRGLIYLNLGKVHTLQKNLSKAKKYTEKALKMFKLMGNILNVAEAYHIFGLIHGTQGNYSEAELFLDESLKINEQKEYIEGLAETYESYGNLCRQQGQVRCAKKFYDQALLCFQKLNLQLKVQKMFDTINELKLKPENGSQAISECSQ